MSLGMSLELQRDQTPRFHSSRLSREISLLCCSIVLGRVLIGHNKVSVLLCCLSRASNRDKDGNQNFEVSRRAHISNQPKKRCQSALSCRIRYGPALFSPYKRILRTRFLPSIYISHLEIPDSFHLPRLFYFIVWMPLSWFFFYITCSSFFGGSYSGTKIPLSSCR